MTKPEDLKSLLDYIICISRGTRELQALYTQYQENPNQENLKLFRDKESQLDTLIELYKNRLDQCEDNYNSTIIFEENKWGVTVIDNPT